jgi:hypothetical protein
MSNLTPIYYNERLVAAVMPEHTLITAELDAEELRTVKAMCVYAAEIHAGRQDGPYTDQRALAYAHSVPPSPLAPQQTKAGESDTSPGPSSPAAERYPQAAEAIKLAQVAQPHHDAERTAAIAHTTGNGGRNGG